jgi:hypothetical protein
MRRKILQREVSAANGANSSDRAIAIRLAAVLAAATVLLCACEQQPSNIQASRPESKPSIADEQVPNANSHHSPPTR